MEDQLIFKKFTPETIFRITRCTHRNKLGLNFIKKFRLEKNSDKNSDLNIVAIFFFGFISKTWIEKILQLLWIVLLWIAIKCNKLKSYSVTQLWIVETLLLHLNIISNGRQADTKIDLWKSFVSLIEIRNSKKVQTHSTYQYKRNIYQSFDVPENCYRACQRNKVVGASIGSRLKKLMSVMAAIRDIVRSIAHKDRYLLTTIDVSRKLRIWQDPVPIL